MSGKNTKMDHFRSTCSTWLTTSFLLLVIVKVMEIDAASHRYLSNRPQGNYENNAAYFYRQHQLASTATAEQTDTDGDSTDTDTTVNSRSKNPESINNYSNRINCAKGGVKKFPDSKDESKFHMCTFSTAHRIWLVYSFHCPKLTIFDKKSQKCGSRESIANAPFKRISWVQRIQQNLQQKQPSSASHSSHSNSNFNSKVRPTTATTTTTTTTTTTEKNPKSSTMVNRTPLKNGTPSYQYIKVQSQNVNRYPNLLQRKTTTTPAPPKTNKFFNRIRPGHITQVNRRYTTTTPASRTRTTNRRPPPTARTTTTAVAKTTATTAVRTTTTTTTTTERATAASQSESHIISSFNSIEEDGSSLNSDLHSNFESEDDPEGSSSKVTGSNLNPDGNIGVIRTVAGKIAYLAQAIESLLTAFEGSMSSQIPCEDFQGAGILNGNPDSEIDANEGVAGDVRVPQPAPAPASAPVPVPVPGPSEPTTPSFISPSDLKNILDFFTGSNPPPVNKDVANKVIGTVAVASASSLIPSPTTSTTTNEQNDPEDPNPPPPEPQVQTGSGAADTTSGSSSEEEQMNEEDTVTVLRLPSPSKEFDLEESPQSQQSSSQILINETMDPTATGVGVGAGETTTSPTRPNNESENQIQQSEQNMNEEEEEEEGETDDSEAAEWNIIVKKPGEIPTPTPPRTSTLNQLQPQDNSPSSTSTSSISTSTGSGIDDSSFSSLSSLDEVDVVLSNVKTSNEKLSAQDNIMFSIPNPTRTGTRFPGALPPSQAEAPHPHPHPTSQSQVAPAPSRTTTTSTTDSRPVSSVVSNEQADILKTGSKGSNRRPR